MTLNLDIIFTRRSFCTFVLEDMKECPESEGNRIEKRKPCFVK